MNNCLDSTSQWISIKKESWACFVASFMMCWILDGYYNLLGRIRSIHSIRTHTLAQSVGKMKLFSIKFCISATMACALTCLFEKIWNTKSYLFRSKNIHIIRFWKTPHALNYTHKYQWCWVVQLSSNPNKLTRQNRWKRCFPIWPLDFHVN